MAAGDRDASLATHLGATLQDRADDLTGELVERHADHREREDRRRAHRVHVGECVGGGDTAEIARIVDDGGEEVGGGDDRLAIVEAIHGGVVRGIGANQQLGRHDTCRHAREQLGQYARSDFATASTAVGELRQFDFVHIREGVAGEPMRTRKIMHKGVATVAQLSDFDEIIDARSPAEFAEDHIPGAINLPVLDDAQRIVVGTLYKQQSAFAARRLGGALVAENIARHLQDHLQDKPKHWRALIYCWRGGQRSGAFVSWLRMVGWDAHQLQGGYKRFRHLVIAEIERIAPALQWRVVCGPTGSAKTRVLEALARAGAQTLDLEDLAAHKGSVLGALPDRPQPTQKSFETTVYTKLQAFDPAQAVYVEAESRKIGHASVPEPLILAMRRAPCVAIDATRAARLEFLVRDYAYLGDDIAGLKSNITRLSELQSRETLVRWHDLATRHALPELFGELIDLHYDPLYRRSQNGNYAGFNSAARLHTDSLSDAGIDALARRILQLDAEAGAVTAAL